MPEVTDVRVLVDAATKDDAAVVRLSDDRALVASVDFFAPIVDDPYQFGAIAAANAWSDVYAMGAMPLLALNLVAWPREPELLELLGDALRGMGEITRQAGAFVLGGHSIDDREPKLGLVALGEVNPARLIRTQGAVPGDRLVLTKPLGTGVLSTALKQDRIDPNTMARAVEVMTTLNDGAARAMIKVGAPVHAATDVTGFGLLGHLANLLEASGCSASISVAAVPELDGVRYSIGEGLIPGGTNRNVKHAEEFCDWHDDTTSSDRVLLSDAQTSGGLLIAVEPSAETELLDALRDNRTPAAAVIGTVEPEAGKRIRILP